MACSEKKESLPYYNSPDFSPQFIQNAEEVSQKITHRIADFAFSDQNHVKITQEDIEGKIHIANFMFTSCGSICPKMMANLDAVQEAFGKNQEVLMLSYSVSPWIDKPEVLKQYAQNHQITASNWHLLTGDKAQIYELARKSYFAEEDLGFSLDSTDFLHTEHILLVDPSKRIRGIYNGTLSLEIKQLIRDIHALLEE